MALRRSEARGHDGASLSRAQTLENCARLAAYSEAGATPRALLMQAGADAAGRFPEDVDVLVAVGRMYLMGEELAEAERVLRRVARRAPQDAHALRLLGEVMLRQGDPKAAHAALSSAVACGMNDPWTKTWVARALDYSELEGDLGRDGIARDVRQVLGKPGQGPPDDARRLAPVAPSDPPAKRNSRTQVLGKIDKGIFFAGDPRAEQPDLRNSNSKWGVGPDDVVDLPTPAPGGVRHDELGISGVHESAARGAVAAALGEDAAWSAPGSEPNPPSDTEISAWVPEMEAAPSRRRSGPPAVELRRSDPPGRKPRSTEPPPAGGRTVQRIAPLPPGLPRLSAGELFDEFTEHKRDQKTLQRAAEEVQRRAGGAPGKGPPPLPPEPGRKGPPPLPPSAAPVSHEASAPGGLVITMLEGDMEGPVTAPPSALIPLDDAPIASRAAAGRGREAFDAVGPATDRDGAPASAPPSALLPPEPPSLQIPSRLLLGAADVEESAGRAADPGAPYGAQAPAPEVKPRSRVQGIVLRMLALVALGAVLAGGYEVYKRNRATKIRALAAQASVSLHQGGPAGVADAEAALASARSIDPKSRLVANSTLRMLFFAVIDVDPGRAPALSTAMDHAASLGVRSSDMAYASIARAVASGDPASATEIINNYDEDPDRAADALYQLAAGAAMEPLDPAAAIERYRTAAKLNGDVLSTEVRIVRALAYSGHGTEARQRLAALAQKWPDRAEPRVLAAILAAIDPQPGESVTLDPATDPDALPRSVRASARCLTKGGDEQAVAKGIAEAEVAPTVVLCGEIALRAGHEGSAREAAKRALEISSSYAPAYALVARVALAAGRFEEARQAALRAPADVAAEILAFIAYEAGDLAAMTSAAGRRANDPPTEPVAAGVARLAGAAPIAAPVLAALAKSPRFWADVVAMDAALDAGDLALAQTVASAWHGADKHPIRASRVARLLRYQGKNGAAQTAAASASPTLAARVEGALASAEMAAARSAAIESLAGARTPEERWAQAFLLAREGRVGPARIAVRDVAVPGPTAPLLSRVVAALALGELRMRVLTQPLFVSLEPWSRNPDVARALGLAAPREPGATVPATDTGTPVPSTTPVTAPATAPAAPPDKAPPKVKAPKQDDGDPY